MSSTALKTFAVALIVLAVIFGGVAYYMSQRMSGPQTPVSRPVPADDRVLAVVAVAPLPPYQQITAEDVALVPISVEPAQYFTDAGAVVGRTPLRAVAVGAPVTEQAFGTPSALAEAVPPGAQAMSLEVTDVIAVGGFVQPGDVVDVLVYLRESGSEVDASHARVLLREARVLAYRQQLINVGDDGGTQSAGNSRQRTVVLAVPEEQTTRVMLGASLGELRLALRAPQPASDAQQAETRQVLAPESQATHGSPPAVAESERAQVVTLAELAEIEASDDAQPPRTPAPPRRDAPRATIEVYQGSDANRVDRPYQGG